MKTFIADIIPRLKRFSLKIDDITKLTNQHWVSLDDIDHSKRVYIFRPDNKLIISDNGIVEKGSWEYLGNQSLLMETKHESYLLKHGFFDENVIALKLDSTNSYAFFVNETKYHDELNNIADILQFLEAKYLNKYSPDPVAPPRKKSNIAEGYAYSVISETEDHDFFWGSYTTFKLGYSNGKTAIIYQGFPSRKFFYLDHTAQKFTFDNLDEAAHHCFIYLENKED